MKRKLNSIIQKNKRKKTYIDFHILMEILKFCDNETLIQIEHISKVFQKSSLYLIKKINIKFNMSEYKHINIKKYCKLKSLKLIIVRPDNYREDTKVNIKGSASWIQFCLLRQIKHTIDYVSIYLKLERGFPNFYNEDTFSNLNLHNLYKLPVLKAKISIQSSTLNKLFNKEECNWTNNNVKKLKIAIDFDIRNLINYEIPLYYEKSFLQLTKLFPSLEHIFFYKTNYYYSFNFETLNEVKKYIEKETTVKITIKKNK